MSDLAQAGILVAALAVVFVLVSWAMRQREARWESDDWRQSQRGSVKVGNALLEVHSLLEPSRRNQVEETQRARLEEEESGDPPVAGDDESPAAESDPPRGTP